MLTALKFIVKGTFMSTILSTIRVTQGRHEFSNWVNTLGGGGGLLLRLVVTGSVVIHLG